MLKYITYVYKIQIRLDIDSIYAVDIRKKLDIEQKEINIDQIYRYKQINRLDIG